jgi:hypothetical protein
MEGTSRRQRRREAVRARLQRSAHAYLEQGETIQLWVLGMTGPIPTNAVEGLINLFRWAVGTSRPAGVLLTDRAVHVARTGWFKSEVRDVIASYPLGLSPPHVEFEQRGPMPGSITVNSQTVYLPKVSFESAANIASAVTAAEREAHATTPPRHSG